MTIGIETPQTPLSRWSTGAKAAYTGVLELRPHLAGAELAQLTQACELLTRADKYERRVDRDGPVSIGSTGQPVQHPLIGPALQARTAAASILDRLTDGRGPGARQRAGLRRGTH
jgi:hypothetical protein